MASPRGFSNLVKWTYNKSWVWEDADGLLFQVSGLRCEKLELMAAAESIQRCSQTPKTLKLGWKPDNTSLFLAYAAADTVEELWSRNNIAITFTYSVSPIAAPAGTARSVSVNGAKASFYPAQEAYRGSSGTTLIDCWDASGTSSVVFHETTVVTSGKTYRLTLVGTSNGKAFTPQSITKTCP